MTNPSTASVALIRPALLVELLSTFGSVASFILRRICKEKGKEIHLGFDKTVLPSVKDCERDTRAGSQNTTYQILGQEQKRPGNRLLALRQDQFKKALVDFLTSKTRKRSYW